MNFVHVQEVLFSKRHVTGDPNMTGGRDLTQIVLNLRRNFFNFFQLFNDNCKYFVRWLSAHPHCSCIGDGSGVCFPATWVPVVDTRSWKGPIGLQGGPKNCTMRKCIKDAVVVQFGPPCTLLVLVPTESRKLEWMVSPGHYIVNGICAYVVT